ncbi:MAG: nucleotidyltransferase domain-containing protein [Candidatus Omnitrophota bacterium]
MNKDQFLQQVKRTVQEMEPDAEVLLFGSRARGDAAPDSDWDFLILVDKSIDDKEKMNIRHRLYEIEWEMGEVISSVIHSREEWNRPRMKITPFHQNVSQEGIPL